jgi:hypothetical protein
MTWNLDEEDVYKPEPYKLSILALKAIRAAESREREEVVLP